jgi:hypothetical protein
MLRYGLSAFTEKLVSFNIGRVLISCIPEEKAILHEVSPQTLVSKVIAWYFGMMSISQ